MICKRNSGTRARLIAFAGAALLRLCPYCASCAPLEARAATAPKATLLETRAATAPKATLQIDIDQQSQASVTVDVSPGEDQNFRPIYLVLPFSLQGSGIAVSP